ncbi:MAG: type II toxin-antitoxin system VapC family toxin [Pseudomonadales bacterium]
MADIVRIFFDSSAFAKRYVSEAGTDDVLSLCQQATELCLSAIAIPELVSAFCRLQREGHITMVQYQALKKNLLLDIADAAVCDLTPTVMRHTLLSLEENNLRAMDAIHVGSALALQVDRFVTADVRQLNAAKQMGLQVFHV